MYPGKERQCMFQNTLNFALIALFLMGFCCFTGIAQDSTVVQSTKDSTLTPFQKGGWLSGLSGNFSSSTLKLNSAENLISSNSLGLEIFTGTFIKERFLLGINLAARSSSGNGLIESESETLLVGPSVSYYFLDESYGSLYLKVLPGYLRVRESSVFRPNDQIINELAEGPGFALQTRLGFAYALSSRIILDVGVGTTFSWADITYTSDILESTTTESVFSNTTFFSFGFNVLLDEFFF